MEYYGVSDEDENYDYADYDTDDGWMISPSYSHEILCRIHGDYINDMGVRRLDGDLIIEVTPSIVRRAVAAKYQWTTHLMDPILVYIRSLTMDSEDVYFCQDPIVSDGDNWYWALSLENRREMKKKSIGFVLINTPVPQEDQEEDDRHFSVLEIHNKSTDWKAGLIMKQLYGSFEVGTMMELCNWLVSKYFEAETVCFDIDDAEVDRDKSKMHMSHVIFKEDEYIL